MLAPGAVAALAATLARDLDTVRPSPSHAVLAPDAAEWWRLAWLTAGAGQPVPVASWRDIVAVLGAVGTLAQVQQTPLFEAIAAHYR